MEKKRQAFTPINRKKFDYTGSLDEGIYVFKNSKDGKKPFYFPAEDIQVITSIMQRVCPAILGTSWKNPPKYSIGYTFKKEKEKEKGKRNNPQILSYVIPLLIEDGFCEVDRKQMKLE